MLLTIILVLYLLLVIMLWLTYPVFMAVMTVAGIIWFTYEVWTAPLAPPHADDMMA